jgi:class 3 adenylate cyclase
MLVNRFKEEPMKSLILKYHPILLIAFPCVLAEILGTLTLFAGKYLISEYLLQYPVVNFQMPLLGKILLVALELLYVSTNIYFLLPLFSVFKNGTFLPGKDLSVAKTRVYNFPAFLILTVWAINCLDNLVLYLFKPDFFTTLPFLFTAIISTILTAVFVYYSSEFLNRFLLIPYWFSDSKIKVNWKIRVPSLFLRFGDSFLVSGILPVVSILGIISLTILHGNHDEHELERILYVSGSIGFIFWVFGGILTLLNSKTFLNPLQSMENALKEYGEGNYKQRISVHSDDQLGLLEHTVNQMGIELEEKEIIKTVFGHYVSPAIRDMILGGKVKTEGDKIEAVILFTDIRSFTSLSELHPPENIVKLLNIHFTRIVDIVSRNDGFVDKFIGDAVMAVFDEELTRGQHKLSALRAAAEILKELELTNSEISSFGFPPLKIGIGIASGPVIRGNIGSENRREMTVIGETVNLASRLESATKNYGSPILITESSFDETCEDFKPLQKKSEEFMQIRGKTELVKVFVLDLTV